MVFLFLPCALSAYYSTFKFNYFPHPNVQYFGWPVPWGIWQRVSPTSPWLDYVSPLSILAWPANMFIFYGVSLIPLWLIQQITKPFRSKPA